jgi:hypothetical protein
VSEPRKTLADAVSEMQSAWASLVNGIAVVAIRKANELDASAVEAHDIVETPNGAVCAACLAPWPCDRFYVLTDRWNAHRDERWES